MLTGIALLSLSLALSLTACQSSTPQQETQPEVFSDPTTQPQLENSADSLVVPSAINMSETETSVSGTPEAMKENDPILIYTGIQTTITEHDAGYAYYDELKNYLNERQFTLIRIAHKEKTELFEGHESLEWDAEDWDLVSPLNHISSSDCGYGKIDYNNDGKMEIIYRAINTFRQITATVYQPDDAAEQIVDQYNLVHIFQNSAPQDSTLQQLWFEQIGEDIVTFRLLQKDDSEDFIIYSDLVNTVDGEPACSHLETRSLTVTTSLYDTLEQVDQQDIFLDHILDLTTGQGEAFQAFRRDQLISCQKERPISSAIKTTILPEGLLQILEETLAEMPQYANTSDLETLSAYEDQTHQLTLEQVQTYLGEAFSDYYDWGYIKTIWQPSSPSTSLGLIIHFYKEYNTYLHETWVRFPCFIDSTSADTYSDPYRFGTVVDSDEMFDTTPVQLWFEEFDQKVYTFYLKRVGTGSDYLLEVSLIEGKQLYPLLQYLLIAEKEYTFTQSPR